MTILGINASGRSTVKNEQGLILKGVTEEMVKHILENTGEPWEYVSLAGKTIRGCQACLLCAPDNVCKLEGASLRYDVKPRPLPPPPPPPHPPLHILSPPPPPPSSVALHHCDFLLRATLL